MYMDADKIFGLFNDKEPEPSGVESQEEDLLLNYKEQPLFWVGMFKKLINNHRVFNDKVIDFFSKLENEELNVYDVEEAGEFIVYNRAWFWISKIDTQDRKCQDAILYFNDEFLETSLKFTISYFEEIEEYEKCAHLQKILNICEKF